MSIRHMEGFEQYAAQADLANSYVISGAGLWEVSTDTPFGRGQSIKKNQPALNHNGLIKPISAVPQGSYVGSAFWFKATTFPYAADYGYLLQFCEGTTVHFGLGIDNLGYVYPTRGTTAIAPSFNRPLLLDTWYHLEVRVKIDDVTGEVELRVNGETWGALSGLDTRNANTGVINTARLFPVNSSTVNRNGVYLADNWVVWDTEGAVNNSWVGDAEVLTVFPSADDNLGTWVANTGEAWDAINEVGSDGDATYIASETVDDAATFVLGALPLIPKKVLAVGSHVVARKNDSGNRSIRHGIVSGTQEALSQPIGLGTTYASSSAIFDTDPETGAAWTPAAAAAVKSKVKVAA